VYRLPLVAPPAGASDTPAARRPRRERPILAQYEGARRPWAKNERPRSQFPSENSGITGMPRAALGIFARNWQMFGGLGENSKRAKMVAA
jgi:hypothetical protein